MRLKFILSAVSNDDPRRQSVTLSFPFDGSQEQYERQEQLAKNEIYQLFSKDDYSDHLMVAKLGKEFFKVDL